MKGLYHFIPLMQLHYNNVIFWRRNLVVKCREDHKRIDTSQVGMSRFSFRFTFSRDYGILSAYILTKNQELDACFIGMLN